MRELRRFLLPVGMALFVFVAIACGSNAATSSLAPDATSTATPAATATSQPAPSQFELMLRMMPDTPESRAHTRVNLLQPMAESLGIAIPGPDAGLQEVIDYRTQLLVRLNELGVPISGEEALTGVNEHLDRMPDTKQFLGFDTRDLVMYAVTGEAVFSRPAPFFEVLLGDINPELAITLLESCEGCAEAPERIEYRGAVFYSWGDDFQGSLRNRYEPPAFDFLGRGGRLFFGDGFAARSLRAKEIEALIDLVSGSKSSLADVEAWAIAASGMKQLGALSATFTDRTNNKLVELPVYLHFDETIGNYPQEMRGRYENFDEIANEVVSASPELPLSQVIAAGVGFEGGESFAALSIVFDDADAAAQAGLALRERVDSGLALNFDLTTTPWTDLIETAEIAVEGRVVNVKVVPAEGDEGRQSSDLRRFLPAIPFFTEVPYVSFLLR